MKLAILLGAMSVGSRPLDFWYNNIFESSRGATGTDIALCMLSKELCKLGHDVHIFTVHAQPHNKPDDWEGCKLYNFIDRHTVIDDSFDAMVSLNEPDVFRGVNSKALRICYQFLNDFTYCQPDFDTFVDHWVGVCESHKNYLSTQARAPSIDKWSVIPLGVDPTWYTDERIPGRVVWTSSADRGLHNLLEIWPKVKAAVPEASLRIFYHFEYGNLLQVEPNDYSQHHFHTVEMSHRLRYIVEAVKKLKPLGVEHCKSISRNQMVKEMNEASVFAFPCDTVATTEGFSVSTLEAHASFTVPVMTDQDCLGSIYNDSGAIVIKSPVRDRLSEFTDAVIKSLTDKNYADSVISKCREFAFEHTWANTAEKIEQIILGNEIKQEIIYTKSIEKRQDLVKLNIGCGPNVFPFDGWINYDREDVKIHIDATKNMTNFHQMPDHQINLAKYLQKGGNIDFRVHNFMNPFNQYSDDSVDLIYVGQAIEHINPIYEAPKFINECYRMLKKNGVLRMTTPDLDLLIQAYLNNDMDKFSKEQPDFYKDADPSAQLAYLMYGASGPNCTWNNYEGHMCLYTQKSMTALLEKSGFKDIVYYYDSGKSKNEVMAKEAVDCGMSHSFIVEAVKGRSYVT